MRFEMLQCQTITETVLKLKMGSEVSFEDFTGKKTTIKASRLLCVKKMDDKHHRVSYYRKMAIGGGQCKRIKDSDVSGMCVIVLPDNSQLMIRRSWVKIYDKE